MRFYRILIFLSILLPAGWFQLAAQEPFFRQVTLPGANTGFRINAICQDSSKFVWLATNDGLWKNDGLNFSRVKLPDAISGNSIVSVSAWPDGGVIAGTANGKIFKVVNDSILLVPVLSFEIDVPVSCIYVPVQNEIWFSTMGRGLFRMLGNEVTNFTVVDGLGDDYIYCIASDTNGNIWTGSDGGLSQVFRVNDSFKIRNLNTSNGLPDNIIRQIIPGPGNTIGIGMEEKGFCVYDIRENLFLYKTKFDNWSYGPVTSLVRLENEFWLGTQKFGIIDFEFQADRRMRQFSASSGFTGQNVNALLKDHEGNIWIGAGNELFLSPGEKIEFKRQIADVSLNTIHTILVDRQQNMWFSNDSGVFCYRKNLKDEFRVSIPQSKLLTEPLNVISLYEDMYGYIWMGTFDYGVFRYNPIMDEWLNFSEKEGLVNSSVLSIDGDGKELWFATLGGVSKCILPDSNFKSGIDFVSYNEENGLGNNFIYKVFVDSKKRVWFGTDGKGITSFENGTFKNFSEAEGLKSKVIYSIAEDKNGMIWLSSSGEGIYRFDGKSFRNISVDQGLSDLNVTSLIADNSGNIIIVHKKGIDILNPDNFYLLSYGSEMGIGIIDPDVNVVDADDKGNVWLGTTDGIIKLKLENRVGDNKPVLIINHVLCFLEKVDTTTLNVFSYDRNHISFDYTTIWYADPQKISYQYKLDGYNQEWITTRDRFITFPNLRPGSYKFMVRTSVNNNFSNAEIVSYDFRIRYPFWQRSWFIIAVTSLIILLLYFYITYRDRRLKSIDRLKKEKIESQYEILKNQVNPHFLFNSFNTLITVIEDDKNVAIEYVNKLSDFFRCILTYREKDLILISEELELVETYVFLQQKRYGNNFKVLINIPQAIRNQCLIPPLALQILVENSLKHNSVSRETRLVVEVYEESGSYLVVKNNINPKFTKEPSTGIGIQNLKNRYQLISSSELVIEETSDYFIVKLPLIKIQTT